MFKILILSVFVVICKAGGYSSGKSSGNSGGAYGGGTSRGGAGGVVGGGLGGGLGGDLGAGLGGGISGAGLGLSGGFGGGTITAAVQSRHSVEYLPVPLKSEPYIPQVVEVDATLLPLTIFFKSASSNINVVHNHVGGVGDIQETKSEDEPHKLIHEVTKPIYQEVREVITPYRKVIQEIRPVKEEIQTIVAKGDLRYNGGYGQSVGGFSGGYAGASNRGRSSGKY